MNDFYDRDGNPITLEQWREKFSDEEYKRIARSEVDGVEISTVWIGLDHGCDGRRAIFETMIFGGELDSQMQRYATKEEAMIGHVEMVNRILKAEGESK